MARKKHSELRTLRDLRSRKRMNDSLRWGERMMGELNGEQPEEKEQVKLGKASGNKETAKRLSSDNY